MSGTLHVRRWTDWVSLSREDFHWATTSTITRREFWADDSGPAITLDEWLEYASSDAELEPDPQNRAPRNWRIASHPDRWPLWWRRGEVYTKNPDDAVIAKLVRIARRLGARVVGDDDEVYGDEP